MTTGATMTPASSLIGHNHPPSDEPTAPVSDDAEWVFETRGDLPPDLPKMYFFLCDIPALYSALLRMPLDQRGFYMTALLAMYERMEPLPADDRAGMIATGVTDIRIYRRLKMALLETERCLVQKPSGRITNARFEEEISKYVQKFTNRSAGRKKVSADTSLDVAANQDAHLANPLANPLANHVASPVGSSDVAGVLSEKINKINDAVLSIQAQLIVNDPDKLRIRVIKKEDSKENSEAQPHNESLELPLSETDVSDVGAKPSIGKLRTAYSAAFDAFWKDYPDTRGMSKSEAWKAWQKLSAGDRVQAHAAVPAFRQQLDERRRKSADAVALHAQGYLRQRRFETFANSDDGTDENRPWWADEKNLRMVTHDQWRGSIGKHANGKWPVAKLGPPPGSLRCVVPPDIVDELRLTEIYTDGGLKRNEGESHD